MTVSVLCAEEFPVAVLEYFDDPWELVIYDFTGHELEDFDFGTELLIGYGIQTYDCFAELRLEPNGTILNLEPHTFIKLKELQGVAGTRQNAFAQASGKVRVVAARSRGDNYSLLTPSMALGVRGTDFITTVDKNGTVSVAVNEGIVDIYNPHTGSEMELIKGDIARSQRRLLRIMEGEDAAVRRMVEESRFRRLDPETVPRFDFEEYYNEFEYFREIEREAYLEYFADDDFFDDYREYMERFRDYYSSEMEDFHKILEAEEEAVREALREEEEAIQQGRDDAREAWKNDQSSFQEYLENN